MNPIDVAIQYHEATKHHFHRFASSLGFLDWENQPDPFRTYAGAPEIALERNPERAGVTYSDLYGCDVEPLPLDHQSISSFLRHSMALSAWKEHLGARWALRVNPSSGNLHPTEAYLVAAGVDGFPDREPAVYHYVASSHVLEKRCALPKSVFWTLAGGVAVDGFLVGLTSILWREVWKYGERAFRYCQHDIGHALAALRLSASLCGWELRVLPGWSSAAISRLLGVDRDQDRAGGPVEAEAEEAELLAFVRPNGSTAEPPLRPAESALEEAASATWSGRANALSEERVDWPAIAAVAEATRSDGVDLTAQESPSGAPGSSHSGLATRIILQRRSAVSMAPGNEIDREVFLSMLGRVLPGSGPPFDALTWKPAIHLMLFVHGVRGLTSGLYLLVRNPDHLDTLKRSTNDSFAWQATDDTPVGRCLFLLKEGDFRSQATLVSCDQEIAGHSFFSMGMIAEFRDSLARHGASFYRNLFWETGAIGQVLYLEAEAAGVRSTGIGCFYDDPVHELLGLDGNHFQSLYHFTVGVPVEDTRISTLPPY